MEKPFRKISFVIVPGIPLLMLAIVIAAAIYATYFSDIDPNVGNLYERFTPPYWMEGGNAAYPLGTDYFGRDNLTRLMVGAKISLSVAFLVTLIGATFGTFVGLLAGYRGGVIDAILMRVVDGWLSFPAVLIAILFAVSVGQSYFNVIMILSLLMWPNYARQIRGEALSIMQQDFIALDKVAGASGFRTMVKHLFPNVVPTLIVIATLGLAHVIQMEAMLSFLGAGIPPPMASWGAMAAEGRDYIDVHWWLSTFPGLAIFLMVIAVNLLGDWLRDRLDPTLRLL